MKKLTRAHEKVHKLEDKLKKRDVEFSTLDRKLEDAERRESASESTADSIKDRLKELDRKITDLSRERPVRHDELARARAEKRTRLAQLKMQQRVIARFSSIANHLRNQALTSWYKLRRDVRVNKP